MEIVKIEGIYYVVDTRTGIKYELDGNKCLLGQINDICNNIILAKEE